VIILISEKVLVGPNAGQTQEIYGNDPWQFFNDHIQNDLPWELDYSRATEEEKNLWCQEDINFRCIRALKTGHTVRLLGKIYQGVESIPQIDKAINNASRKIGILSDDDYGVVIAAVEKNS